MARELGVRLDAMELQVDANPSVGINDRQRDFICLWLQAVVRGKRVANNMADLGTKSLERETIDRHVEKLKCV